MQSTDTNRTAEVRHVFIIGCKGIPAAYGGFETFVDKLTEYRRSDRIRYHVACKGEDDRVFRYNDADCFTIRAPGTKPQMSVYYDLAALRRVIRYIKTHTEICEPVVYVLACRVGPFIWKYARQIHRLGGKLFVNPDGHEWMRAKWSPPVRRYWKLSERLMVKHADLLICDSQTIERYIRTEYSRLHPVTTYIAYGSEMRPTGRADRSPSCQTFFDTHGLSADGYYLIVGRFVPENNYETMIREFLRSGTKRKLVIITTPNQILYEELDRRLHFTEDSRVCFAGTVYDQDLLEEIRRGAHAYLHGHSVGGTNPSLLEALGATDLNLLYDVGFNREVAKDAALYWTLEEGSLSSLIDRADRMTETEIIPFGQRARKRIREAFSWPFIVSEYERLLLDGVMPAEGKAGSEGGSQEK